jgi:hypothetical protein
MYALAALLAIGGVIGYGHYRYEAGDKNGSDRVTVAWDKDKVQIQAVTDAAIAAQTKAKEDAIAANEGIQNDLQIQLNSVRVLNTQLSQRLRSASLAANSSTVSKGADNPGTPSSATIARMGQINDAIAASLTECRTNWANYNALIKELGPQL